MKRQERRHRFPRHEVLESRRLMVANHVFAQFSGNLSDSSPQQQIHFSLSANDFNLSGSKAVLGFQIQRQAGSGLDPAAVQIFSGASCLATRLVVPNLAANSQSLVIAELAFGNYTLNVNADQGTRGAFQLDVFLAGDVLGNDHKVDMSDATQVRNLLGATVASPSYRVEADANLDGIITSFDYTQARDNLNDSVNIRPLLGISLATVPAPVVLPSGRLATNSSSVAIQGVTQSLIGVSLETGSDANFDNGTTTSNASGNYVFPTVPMQVGANTLRVRAKDGFGQQAFGAIDLFLDNQAPVLAINGPLAGQMAVNSTVSGKVTDNLSGAKLLKVSLDSGAELSVPFDAEGNFSYTPSLSLDGSADGEHTLRITAIDFVGNISPATELKWILDTTAPVQPVFDLASAFDSAPVGDYRTTFGNVSLVGQTEAGARVLLEQTGATTTADTNGQFTFASVALTLGENLFATRATDASGNARRFERTVTRDPEVCSADASFVGWTSSESGGVGAGIGSVVSQACSRILTEGNSYSVAIEKSISIPATPSAITVSFAGLRFDTTAANAIKDALEIALVDASGNSLVTPIQLGSNALFNATEGFVNYKSADGVVVDGDRVTIGLGGLPAGSNARFIARLINNDDDRNSRVAITSFQVSPSSLTARTLSAPDTSLRSTASSRAFSNVSLASLLPSVTADPTPELNAPTLAISTLPSVLPIGQALLINGKVTATVPDTIATVLVDGAAVDALDASGNLFHAVTIEPGLNRFVVSATDSQGRSTTKSLSVFGASADSLAADFSRLTVRTSSMKSVYGRTSIGNAGDNLSFELASRNESGVAVDTPLLVAVRNISDPSVRLVSYDGVTPNGDRYIDYSNQVANHTLAPGQSSSSPTLQFFNPKHVRFTYDLDFYSEENDAPQITSVPNLEAVIGKPYQYQVNAMDLNSDTLQYRLLQSPSGMSISSGTGIISWSPIATDLGSRSVVIQVDDGRGGAEEQSFVLSAITAPANRPPVFTSDPVVSTRAGEQYTYSAHATDRDSDVISYFLVNAPSGMSINATTGLVSWQATNAQIGKSAVVIEARDGNGGVATQTFDIVVGSASENLPPVITSAAPPNYNLPDVSNSSSGNVTPTSISLNLQQGQSADQTITVQLPTQNVQQGTADVVFMVDETMKVTQSQTRPGKDWIGDLGLQLDQSLQAKGIAENRFGLIGMGQRNTMMVEHPVRQFSDLDFFRTNERFAVSSISTADLDNDGDLDLVLCPGYDLFIYKNDGHGNYTQTTRIATYPNPFTDLKLADVDSDGKVDMVTSEANQFSSEVHGIKVWKGRGDGTFNTPIALGPKFINNIEISDLDRDGKLDLVALGANRAGLAYVFLNLGSLNFSPAVSFPYTTTPQPNDFSAWLSVGDFNGDHIPDIVASEFYDTRLFILQGVGDGTFRSTVATDPRIPSPGQRFGLEVVDLNFDGFSDIVTPNANGYLQVWSGKSDGTLKSPNDVFVGAISLANFSDELAIGDTNGDGYLDAVFAGDRGMLTVLEGSSNGGFSNKKTYATSSLLNYEVSSASLVDIDKDGDLDFIRSFDGGSGSDRLTIVRNDDGDFRAELAGIGVPNPPRDVKSGDIDRDGNEDLVSVSFKGARNQFAVTPTTVSIVFGDGHGGSKAVENYVQGTNSSFLALGDINQDGYLDIVSDTSLKNLQVLLNDGHGKFQSAAIVSLGKNSISGLALDDSNKDGFLDVVISSQNGISTLYGDGSGRFGNESTIFTGTANAFAMSDLTGDGQTDYAVANGRSLQLMRSDGNGKFNTSAILLAKTTITSVNFVDSNSDGMLDIVLADVDGNVVTMVGDEHGALTYLDEVSIFQKLIGFSSSNGITHQRRSIRQMRLADLNGDSFSDAVLIDHDGGIVVLFGDRLGSFDRQAEYDVVSSDNVGGAEGLELLDFNNDGSLDIAFANSQSMSTSFLLNDGNGDFGRFGSANNFTNAIEARGASSISEGSDGYWGISTALNYANRRESTALYVLVSDSRRARLDSSLSFGAIAEKMLQSNGRFAFVVDAKFQDANGNPAIGLDGQSRAIVLNENGGFELRPGGKAVSGTGVLDYVELAKAVGGSSWDLSLLSSASGQAAFQAFVTQTTKEVQKGMGLKVVSSDPRVVVDNLTGVVKGVAAGDTASFNIRVNGSDLPRTFDLLFVRDESGNVMGSIPVQLNTPEYRYQIQARDPDGDVLRYRLIDGPAGASVDANTGLLRWNPQVATTARFSIEVSDQKGGIAVQKFTVDVKLGEPNTVPILSPIGPLQANASTSFTTTIRASDPDGDSLAYFLVNAPAGVAVDQSTGVVSWTPTVAQIGKQTIEYQVIDGRSKSATGKIDVTVQKEIRNKFPRISAIDDQVVMAGDRFVLPALATDADNEKLTWDLPVAPDGMQIDGNTGVISWTTPAYRVAPFDVIVRVRDPRGGVDMRSFSIQLSPLNTAPQVSFVGIVTAVAGFPRRLPVKAQDAENNEMVYSLFNAPSGMKVNASTGVISWTPLSSQIGTHVFQVIVDDRQGGVSTQSIAMNVVADAPNISPSIAPIYNLTPVVERELTYQLFASDADGDPLQFSLVSGPSGASVSPEGLLRWKPTASQVGEARIVVTVSDGRGGTDRLESVVNVLSTHRNNPPVVLSTPVTNAVVGQVYAYDLTALDQDGDQVRWTMVNAPTGLSLDSDRGTLRWLPTADQIGKHVIQIFALDSSPSGFGAFAGTDHVFTIDVRATNTPPRFTSTPVTSASSGANYFYSARASDVDGDNVTYSVVAAPIGLAVDRASGLVTWRPSTTQTFPQSVTLRADDPNGGSTTQKFDIVVSNSSANLPPTLSSTPTFRATVAQPYTYQMLGADPEGQALRYSVLTGPAGASIGSTTGLFTWIPQANQLGDVTISLQAADGNGGKAIQEYVVRVLATNAQPVIASVTSTRGTVGRTYLVDVRATDADGDALTYSLLKSPSGMNIDPVSGQLRWKPTAAQVGSNAVEIKVVDERGAASSLAFSIDVTADANPPKIDIAFSKNPVKKGDSVAILVISSDNVGIEKLSLLIDGTKAELGANGQVLYVADKAGDIQVVASAEDAQGLVTEQTTVLAVVDSSDAQGPGIAISSPTDGASIRAITSVIGSVSGNVASYVLAIAPLGSESFTEIGRGTQQVLNGVLGKIDPSMLVNDSYTLRLSATSVLGDESVIEQTINIAGELKLGNFKLSINDLTVPVTGIPISVTRTYDSLESKNQGEFGYGWRLEFRDTNLRTSVEKTGLESELVYNPFRYGTKVFIQLPGGKREGFTFHPKLAPGIKGAYLGIYEPAFESDPGVTSTLNVQKTDILLTDDGDYFGMSTGTAFNPSSPLFGSQFVVTTSGGIAYDIDGNTGDLRSIFDPSGNEISFNDLSITSSAGPKVTFERDLANRITAVIDPTGKKIQYQYDSNGNLIGVTDRAGGTTRMEYKTDRPHYLDKVIDPLGRTGVRTEYDDSGRLLKVIDAAGKEVRQQYDISNSIVKVFDQLGNPTSYEYDSIGNVVTETNALGGVTKRTYDSAGNTLTETDPLGRTTTKTYDRDGNVLTETNHLGQTTTTTYEKINFGTSLVAKLQGAAAAPFAVPSAVIDAVGNSTRNSYDVRGNLLSTTDPSGVATSIVYGAGGLPSSMTFGGGQMRFEYDAAGRATKQTDALGRVTSSTYDANGNRLTSSTTLTTPSGTRILVTQMEYDGNNRLVKVTNPEGGVVRSEYDKAGNKTSSIDELGRRTEYRFDERGLLVETVFPDNTPQNLTDNPRVKSEFDAAGGEVAKIDEAGRRIEMVYDVLGRLVETIYPDSTPLNQNDNPRIKTEYDAAGQVVATIDELGNRTSFEYDMSGHQTAMIDAQGNKTTSTYDNAGRQIAVTDALGNTTRFTYDASGKRTEQIAPNETKSLTNYDLQGRLASKTDQLNRTTRYEYDPAGKLTAVVDALNQRTEYSYDEAGNMIAQRDAEGRVTRYEYDGLGRRTATVLPMGQRSTTAYDAFGNPIRVTDFNGDVINYSYNERNWLLAKNFPHGSQVSFGYTITGLQKTYVDARGTTTWDYDLRDRLIKRTEPDSKSISYTYDAAGNRTSLTSFAGTITYVFDSLNRTTKVVDPQSGETRYSYNAVGALTKTEFPNSSVETREYDKENHLISEDTAFRNGSVLGFRYALAPTGRRDSVVEKSGRRVDYQYDLLDRLTRESITDSVFGNRSIGYTYDKVGNRNVRNDSAEGSTSYSYDNNDRLLTETLAGKTTTYNYDNNGNTLSKITATDRVFYDWDFENRLIGVDTDGNGTMDVSNKYDTSGIRVAQVLNGAETLYLIDQVQPYAQVVAEYTSGGTIKVSYVYGNDLISQNRDRLYSYYHVDGLGSTRALSFDSRFFFPTEFYNYDAFGRTINATGSYPNTYLFAGEQRDGATGLGYLRARWMVSAVGTFMSQDSFPGTLIDPRTLHRYAYAHANAVNMTDPSGQFSLSEINISLSINTELQSNFAAAGRNALSVIASDSTPLFDAANVLRETGLLGIADDLPGGFEIYRLSRSVETVALRSVQDAILGIYLETLKASLPILEIELHGSLGKVAGLIQSLDNVLESIADFSTADFRDPVDVTNRAKKILEESMSFGAGYKKSFELPF